MFALLMALCLLRQALFFNLCTCRMSGGALLLIFVAASMNLTLIIGIPVSKCSHPEKDSILVCMWIRIQMKFSESMNLGSRFTTRLGIGMRSSSRFSVKQFDPQADGKACVATHTVAVPLLIDGTERFKNAGLCDSLVGYLGDDEREN